MSFPDSLMMEGDGFFKGFRNLEVFKRLPQEALWFCKCFIDFYFLFLLTIYGVPKKGNETRGVIHDNQVVFIVF